MTFQPPTTRQADQSRKVLEEVQMQKKLLKQGAAVTLNPVPVVQTPIQTPAQRKELEQYLQQLEGFTKPKILLEQYETRAHIAACMLHSIESSYGDLGGKMVLDLGCGCSVLGIGATLLGACYVLGVDIDEEALQIASSNIQQFELDNIDLLQCDVKLLPLVLGKKFDTIIMNPPFGTKHNKGLDSLFVEIGLECLSDKGVLYSLHKTSTRDHFARKASGWKVEAKVLAQLRYDLPATYKFHKQSSVDIEVDFWRFEKKLLSSCAGSNKEIEFEYLFLFFKRINNATIGVAAEPTTSMTSESVLGLEGSKSSVTILMDVEASPVLLDSSDGGISSVFPGARASYWCRRACNSYSQVDRPSLSS
nr:EOG090X0BVL [Eurycercus lamellatus]